MTVLVVGTLGLFFAFAVYLATLSARRARSPEDFIDGGRDLPAWSYMFAGTGIVLAALGLHDHFLLSALYGLQYTHVALGILLAALCGALVHKRLWLAARLSGSVSPGELAASYYGSVTLRIVVLALAVLFAVPFAATSLSLLGAVVEAATAGGMMRIQVVWVCGFFLFLFSVIGGWRGVVYVVAAFSFAMLVLLPFVGAFTAGAIDGLSVLSSGIATPEGILSTQIPGVLQSTAGVGKGSTVGGVWTTLAIASFGLSLVGIVLSPGFAFLATTTSTRTGFAFKQVWMTGGLAVGLLLLVAPVLAAQLASDASGGAGLSYAPLLARLAGADEMAAVCLLILLAASLMIAVAFFASSGASVLTLDLVGRSMLPDLPPAGRRLAARITLGVIYAAVALLAAFAPLPAALLGSVALSLSVQLLPAFLGLCWVPWISRSAVLTGLIVGSILVLFTEPPGLVLFEGLFIDLPWGRWPLTIHSAAWGLAFNVAACLLVSIFTRGGVEREHRQVLHDEFAREYRTDFGGPAARAAKWSLVLIWAFLAIGPGAILGNSFFSRPVFTEGEAALGVPSLWVWQIVFWFVGVFLVWWFAYHGRLSVLDKAAARRIDLAPRRGPLQRPVPPWIALLLARVSER